MPSLRPVSVFAGQLQWESFSHLPDGSDSQFRKWQWFRAWIMLGVFLISAAGVFMPSYLRFILLASFLILYCRPDPFQRTGPTSLKR
jgi:hypothetical protein